jgi:hypothetical protein
MLNHNLENYKGCSVNTVSDRQISKRHQISEE